MECIGDMGFGGGGENDQILLSWSFPDSMEVALEGFNVFRSIRRTGPFELLTNPKLVPSSRNFLDEDPFPDSYYKVIAIDHHQKKNSSIAHLAQLNDTIPPDIPTGLMGNIDDDGRVELIWTNNEEPDLFGYRLFRSNSPNGEYIQVSQAVIRDTVFFDLVPLLDLNEVVCYRIRAVDNRQNESEWSEPLILEKPDIVPPAPPLLLSLEPGMGSIGVVHQFSMTSDVAVHRLQRLKVGESVWHTGQETDRAAMDDMIQQAQGQLIFTWIDTTVEQQQEYRYRLLAIDSSDNVSSSAVLTGQAFDDRKRGEIYNEDGTLLQLPDLMFITSNSVGSGIIIEWDYDQLSGLRDFAIYRRRTGEPLREYKTLIVQDGHIRNPTYVHSMDPSQFVTAAFYFFDTQITRTAGYEYRIIARHHDGGNSELSNPIIINVQ